MNNRSLSNISALIFILCFYLNSQAQSNEAPENYLNTITTASPELTLMNSQMQQRSYNGLELSENRISLFSNPAYQNTSKKLYLETSHGPFAMKFAEDLYAGSLAGVYKLNNNDFISIGFSYFTAGPYAYRGGEMERSTTGQFRLAYSKALSEKFTLGTSLGFTSHIVGGHYNDEDDVYEFEYGNKGLISIGGSYAILGTASKPKLVAGLSLINLAATHQYEWNGEASRDYFPSTIALDIAGVYELKDERTALSYGLSISKLLVPTPPITSLDSNGNREIVRGQSDDVNAPQGWIQSFSDAPYGAWEEFKEILFSAYLGASYSPAEDVKLGTTVGVLIEDDTKGARKGLNHTLSVQYRGFEFFSNLELRRFGPRLQTSSYSYELHSLTLGLSVRL